MFGGGSSPRWHLFTLGGHRVYMEPWFLLLTAVFVFMGLNTAQALPYQLMWAPILFFGILLHEFGHAIAIKALGYGPSTIILQGLGGVTINATRGESSPNHSIIISLAGPAVSLLLCVLSYAGLHVYQGTMGGTNALLIYFLGLNALVNLVWTIFNMLPINPLDGGHVVLHALRKFFPVRKALLYSAYSSLATLALVALFAMMTARLGFFVIILTVMFGIQNWQTIQVLKGR